MELTKSRRLQERFIAFGSISIVVGAIALIDETVRSFFTRIMHGDFQIVEAMPGMRAHDLTRMATDLVGRDYVEVAAFALVGGILFLIMVRT